MDAEAVVSDLALDRPDDSDAVEMDLNVAVVNLVIWDAIISDAWILKARMVKLGCGGLKGDATGDRGQGGVVPGLVTRVCALVRRPLAHSVPEHTRGEGEGWPSECTVRECECVCRL